MNTNTWIDFTLTLFLWIFIWTFVSTLLSILKLNNIQILIFCAIGMVIVGYYIYNDPKFNLD